MVCLPVDIVTGVDANIIFLLEVISTSIMVTKYYPIQRWNIERSVFTHNAQKLSTMAPMLLHVSNIEKMPRY